MTQDNTPIEPSTDATVTEQPVKPVVQEVYADDAVDTPEVEAVPDVKKEVKPVEAVDALNRKQQRVVQEFPHAQDTQWDNKRDTVTLPSSHDVETRRAIQQAPNISYVDNPQSRKWAAALEQGLDMSSFGEMFIPTLEDETAEFHQGVEVGGAMLMGQSPKFKAADNENLKGERAVIRAMSHLGLGALYQAPLYHTGIWVTLKPPTESEIVELNRLMVADKVEFGRYSYGLAYSNMTSFMVDRLVDFAIDHIYDTTAKTDELPIDQLKEFISCQDFPALLHGLVCAMYPNGFQYRRACSNDPEKCNHVSEELLNVSKLLWVNTAALTDWQKTHMSARKSKSKDKASIVRYKEELKRIQNLTIKVNDDADNGLSVTLRTPSIGEYVDAGHRWIGEITDVVERALGVDATNNERNNFIKRHSQATAMRNYIHWVQSIEFGTNTIDDRETIESTFNVFSSDDDIRTNYTAAVIDYIHSSTVVVVGIPVFDCPKCDKVQKSSIELVNFKNIIPLDVMQLFFALLHQKLGKLVAR